MRQFDWPAIRAAAERGLTPTEIANTLPDSPSRQAIEKRMKREGWEVATLPNQAPDTQLTGTDATRAVVLQKVRSGVPLGIAARAAGIHPNTLKNWRDDDVTFGEAVQAARAAFLARKIAQVDEAGERDWKAASYLIERAPETRDEFGATKSDNSLTIVLQIDRSEGITIDGSAITDESARTDDDAREPAEDRKQLGT